jgi:pimeloyl-ACP methyl ester carboxylesterase
MQKSCYWVILGLMLLPWGSSSSFAGNGKEHLQPVFHLLFANTPHISVVKTLFAPDETVTVTVNNLAGNDDDWVGIYPDGVASDWGNEVGWAWTGGIKAGTVNIILYNNTPEGIYEARVFFKNSFQVEARCPLLLHASVAIPEPIYSDAVIPQSLTGDTYGAMGEHPVRKISIANPWPAYANGIDDDDGHHYDLQVDIYYPADISGKRPTVFFISGWHVYHSETYRSLLYFVASQGYNCVFIPYRHPDPLSYPELLLTVLDSVVDQFSPIIDTSKVGYVGHSEGGGFVFYLARERPNWGTQGRFIFSIAAWWGFHLPETGNVNYPSNTNLIVQVNHYDNGTDPRQNIDFLLHNTIPVERKTYLYLPGDAEHTADHGVSYSMFENGHYTYDALEQVGLYRPLESLMHYSFGDDDPQWKRIGLPDAGDTNYNVLHKTNGISVLSTDDPLHNLTVPIPVEDNLTENYLCSKSANPRWRMCMPCRDTSRDQAWTQCSEN